MTAGGSDSDSATGAVPFGDAVPVADAACFDGVPVLDDSTVADHIEDFLDTVREFAAADTSRLSPAMALELYGALQHAGALLAGQAPDLLARAIADGALEPHGRTPKTALVSLYGLADRDAARQVLLAEKLGPRRELGQVLAPEWEHVAAAVRDGAITDGHLTVIVDFFTKLPASVDAPTRTECEQTLADVARTVTPAGLRAVATRLLMWIDQDGDEPITGPDPTPTPYLHLDAQDSHGFSKGRLYVNAEARLFLEAIFAKWARPGVNNPADTMPVTDPPAGGSPEPLFDLPADTEEQPPGTVRDTRTVGERQHDALVAVLRAMLASGDLKQHRGSPVTAVITARLSDLEDRTGLALTSTGTVLPIRDAIRLAAHTSPYLLLLGENERPLFLGRTKRLASHDQRLALTALDRGCTFPGCTRPATFSQVHHRTEWAAGGSTDIDQLTYACDQHHALVGDGPTQWLTTTAPPDHEHPGRTLWHPPTCIDPSREGRVNLYHHPEDLLARVRTDRGTSGRTRSAHGAMGTSVRRRSGLPPSRRSPRSVRGCGRE